MFAAGTLAPESRETSDAQRNSSRQSSATGSSSSKLQKKRMTKLLTLDLMFKAADQVSAKYLRMLYTAAAKKPQERDRNDLSNATSALSELGADVQIKGIRRRLLNQEFYSRIIMHYVTKTPPIEKNSLVVFVYGHVITVSDETGLQTSKLNPGDIIEGRHLIETEESTNTEQKEEKVKEKVSYQVLGPTWIIVLSQEDVKGVIRAANWREILDTSNFVASLSSLLAFMKSSLKDNLKIKNYLAKTVLVKQNTKTNKFFVVLDGFVEVVRYNQNKTNRTLEINAGPEAFEDSIMFADHRFSSLPQMSVLRVLGRGGIFNLGNMYRDNKSSFSCIVSSKSATCAVIREKFIEALRESDGELSSLQNGCFDDLDKEEKTLKKKMDKSYGDSTKLYSRLKFDGMIDTIEFQEGFPNKLPANKEGEEGSVKGQIKLIDKGLSALLGPVSKNMKEVYSMKDEINMTYEASKMNNNGFKSFDSSVASPGNNLSFLASSDTLPELSPLKKAAHHVKATKKVLKALELSPADITVAGKTPKGLFSVVSSNMQSRANNSQIKDEAGTLATEVSLSNSKKFIKDGSGVLAKEYLERNETVEKMKQWKQHLLEFKKKISTTKLEALKAASHSKSMDGSLSAIRNPEDEENPNEEFKGRLGGKQILQKILDINDPFRRLPMLNNLVKRKIDVVKSKDSLNQMAFNMADLDGLLKVMHHSSQNTRQTLKQASGNMIKASQARYEKLVRHKSKMLELSLIERERQKKIMSRQFQPVVRNSD